MKHAVLLIALAFIWLAPPAARAGTAGDFDYYVLSLSWSPTWCATPAGRGDNRQCGPGRHYAFVVHGLWPQYDQGWPQYCDTPEHWVPQSLIAANLDIMPSKQLIIHEWRKHGACAGLDQKDYFATLRRFYRALHIPARYLSPTAPVTVTPAGLVSDFVKTNPGLDASMLSLNCGNARDQAHLSELRVCLSRDGRFRPCGRNERHGCKAGILILPPVR